MLVQNASITMNSPTPNPMMGLLFKIRFAHTLVATTLIRAYISRKHLDAIISKMSIPYSALWLN